MEIQKFRNPQLAVSLHHSRLLIYPSHHHIIFIMTAPPPLIQAFSGALGSAVGNAIVFPLDLATARAQHSAKKGEYKL